jgi:type IV fimbrial biogenesis protein FimT
MHSNYPTLHALQPAVTSMRRSCGFTLVELMVVITVACVLLLLGAPAMQDMIQLRRLRAINAQLVTDFQLARSEAVARRNYTRITFEMNPAQPQTCYTIYTAPNSLSRCNCNLGAGAACSAVPNAVEIRTVTIPRSTGSVLSIPGIAGIPKSRFSSVGFEPAMGSLVSLPRDTDPEPLTAYALDTKIDDSRSLRTMLSGAGRPSVCAPAGSQLDVPPCP